MLNVNSPTVRAMLQNTPQGFGNMQIPPVYFGDAPTVTQTIQPINGIVQPQTPFPSPKEMLMQGGQQMVYNPTSFVPRNIVGAYNPGFQAAFAGYSNPFMGYGTFYPQQPIYMTPPDEDSRDRLEVATANGLTYDEQLREESNLYKKISRIVSKNMGRSEEEAKECEDAFEIYNKYPREDLTMERRKIKPIHIQLKVGDEVVADMNPEKTAPRVQGQDYVRNSMFVDQMKLRQMMYVDDKIRRCNLLYERAPERQFDRVDLLDFFNNGAGVLMADSQNRDLYMQSIGRVTQVYDSNGFRKRLLENNGLKSREQRSAVDRFVGRYGVMPDGRPVSPGHDPEIASSFSYDPKTGQYHVTCPNFIKDRLERARESFIRSIDT